MSGSMLIAFVPETEADKEELLRRLALLADDEVDTDATHNIVCDPDDSFNALCEPGEEFEGEQVDWVRHCAREAIDAFLNKKRTDIGGFNAGGREYAWSGGSSWGDPPSEAYNCLALLQELDLTNDLNPRWMSVISNTFALLQERYPNMVSLEKLMSTITVAWNGGHVSTTTEDELLKLARTGVAIHVWLDVEAEKAKQHAEKNDVISARSISDDDLCSSCKHLRVDVVERCGDFFSVCAKVVPTYVWPCVRNGADGHAYECAEYVSMYVGKAPVDDQD